jgi:hypothetical protein
MPDNDFLRQTLTHYREQRQRILEQLRPVDLMIRHIEAELGEAPDTTSTDLPQFFSLDVNAERKPSPVGGKPAAVRGDEFFGMSQGEAARAYLTKVGHAVEVPELVAALNKGGCKVGGADPERTLYIVLIRNTRDFVKVPNGYIGLRAMYPNLRPGQGAAGKPKDKAKKGKRKGSKKKRIAKGTTKRASQEATPESTQPPAKPKESLPVKATVREVLADGQLMTGETIVQRVQEKIGPNAKAFTIFGILKNEKEFEKVDEEYRLKT